MTTGATNFDAIRISLASPDQIKAWSYGEVTKPETINYRTLRPEKDGLFCERIFGPIKDWDCGCGKYKNIRYKGVICDRCGVEVTRAKVRRERMGHISLSAPVAHIWFSKGTPSRLGVLLDISPRNLERILYFSQYIITEIDEEKREEAENALQEYAESESKKEQPKNDDNEDGSEEKDNTAAQIKSRLDELKNLKVMELLNEAQYRDLKEKFGPVFTAEMGADAVLKLLKRIDLEIISQQLKEEITITSGQKRKKSLKRLRIVEAFRKSGNKPEWMILNVLPVLPPDLHPMVQLDGGRFATSDLNDLYRRVINRNNRLKHLLDLEAPEIIVRNEKRMLQEAVDALVDNGRRGRAIQGSHNHVLKSLTDLLRGKQGRFRQNLLGKRVDYSGRSVITVGPNLKLSECGLPRKMALELFKPLVMNSLVIQGYAHNIKSAKRKAESGDDEVWDILQEVIKDHPVLLNRAPTLHRLGIQAFQPVLVEGSAIRLHPLVCPAFNADFDGDQMAVHVPLSEEAIQECKSLMMSSENMLSPGSGTPIVAPTLDLVLGNYYLTQIKDENIDNVKKYNSREDATFAYNVGILDLREKIQVLEMSKKDKPLFTTAGRIIFNDILPESLGYLNETIDKKRLQEIVVSCHEQEGNKITSELLDNMKTLGFKYATQSGTSIAIKDMVVPAIKGSLLKSADAKISKLDQLYSDGLVNDDNERYQKTVDVWTETNEKLTAAVKDTLPYFAGVYTMAESGAKGNIEQIRQMAGMRGLMSDPKGRIIELPIRSSFVEGLSVLEYFISTHGARKGLADTALRTADSGYLTRRLADVAQDLIISSIDDRTNEGILVYDSEENSIQARISERIVGRYPFKNIEDPKTGKVLADTNTLITVELANKIQKSGVKEAWVYSPLGCKSKYGISQKSYGVSMASGTPVLLGEAVGIIAAQSIGEPGTQLTMRTFHTGGVAGLDITSGLPRVVELFEARTPKGVSMLSELNGITTLTIGSQGRTIKVTEKLKKETEFKLPKDSSASLKSGDWVEEGDILSSDKSLVSTNPGIAKVKKGSIIVSWEEEDEREYLIPAASQILVRDGETVEAGQALTAGPKSPHDILRIQGHEAVQRYLIDEVQAVYRSQGVSIHDKHLELIVRQMLRKVKVETTGDSNFLPNELEDKIRFEETVEKLKSEGKTPPTSSPVLLGVTRSSLKTDSFLAAASFQETARVLTEAAVSGSIDNLRGLKENVIIGRLIPARLDKTEEGYEKLGFKNLLKNKLIESEFLNDEDTSEEAVSKDTSEEAKVDLKDTSEDNK
jgi:DNA-directed RNA polymerase subunit beta'